MSELEIRRRQEYKRNRRRWMIIQIIALVIVAAIALSSFLIYSAMNRTYYIEYTEHSAIDYRVQYVGNEFFEEEWLEKDQAYITSLVNSIGADFAYELNMDTKNVGFDYRYSIDAELLIANSKSGAPYYSVTDTLLPQMKGSAIRTDTVEISEHVDIDFDKYNDLATAFVETYNLTNVSATLIVSLNVEVLSSCDEFEQSNENTYTSSLLIPLAEETFIMEQRSSVPESESKVLACKGAASQNVFLVLGIVFASLDVLQIGTLVLFLHLTRNEDVTYAARVRKLLSSYRSFIQPMVGEFDETGYQIVPIKNFTDMLGIRDTIQSPILMTENRDETMTRFLIPTNTKILYVFEIKVDNYDEIYATPVIVEEPEPIPEPEPIVEPEPIPEPEPEPEVVIVEESVDEEALTEALAQPDIVLEEVEFVPDDDDQFEVPPEEPGIEVIGVVWPERSRRNKVYRYDPNGEQLQEGDTVLVPTRDVAQNKEVIRKAAVAHGNHRVDPEHIKFPLKKIIGVIKRKAEAALTPTDIQ